jgi:putative transposase
LCKELRVLRPQRVVSPKVPKIIAINRTVTKPNTLWEVDIKYGYIIGEDRFFYILSYLDVYDRTIVDHYIGLNCCSKDAVVSLKRALMKRSILLQQTPLIIRSDNGPQFTSHRFHIEVSKLKIEHERIPCKTPNKNAHIESYHRIMQDELFNRTEFRSYADAYQAVNKFVYDYNNKRLHGSLGDIPPAEYYMQYLNGKEKKQTIKL